MASTNYNQGVVPIPTQNDATAVVTANVQLFKFNKTTLNIGGAAFPFLSEPGRLNFSTNASYYIKIISGLSWNVSFYGSWDNEPPENLPGSDYGSSSGLSWTFGSNGRHPLRFSSVLIRIPEDNTTNFYTEVFVVTSTIPGTIVISPSG